MALSNDDKKAERALALGFYRPLLSLFLTRDWFIKLLIFRNKIVKARKNYSKTNLKLIDFFFARERETKKGR